MKKLLRIIVVVCLVFSAFAFLGGCADKTVIPLNYALITPSGQSCGGSTAVLKFADARTSRSLGRDGDGRLLQPATDVADWVSWSLYEELSVLGCDVKYHGVRDGLDEQTIVLGKVVDVRLMPLGKTVWKGVVKVSMAVERDGAVGPWETYISEVEKPVIFGVSTREEVLTEALQGVMEQMIPKALR